MKTSVLTNEVGWTGRRSGSPAARDGPDPDFDPVTSRSYEAIPDGGPASPVLRLVRSVPQTTSYRPDPSFDPVGSRANEMLST